MPWPPSGNGPSDAKQAPTVRALPPSPKRIASPGKPKRRGQGAGGIGPPDEGRDAQSAAAQRKPIA